MPVFLNEGIFYHVLSTLVYSTPDITRRRLWMMYFLFVCSTPLRYIFLVTPHGKKFGGKLVIIIACHISDEG